MDSAEASSGIRGGPPPHRKKIPRHSETMAEWCIQHCAGSPLPWRVTQRSKASMSTVDPSLSNRDLTPTGAVQRTWGTYSYIALWFSMSMEITTYQLASSLIAKGMDWKQALATVLLGNLIVLVPMLLNAHAGTKYGIPFPVVIRASFGVRGANIPALLRAVVACGWFGIQTWIGGTAIHSMLSIIWPAAATMNGVRWACFLSFWALNMAIVWRGVESIRRLQAFGAPFMLVMSIALLVWVRGKAGSFGSMLATPSQFRTTHDFLAVFFPSLTAMVGYWATLALNIPDFTRYSKSQSAQAFGQAFGLPVAMTLYTFVGIAVTSASAVIFGHPIWNPITLIGMFHQPVVAFVALVAILIATLNVNIGANVVSPSNDFSNLWPRLISFRTGGLITGFLGIAMCPWKLLASPDSYIFGWLIGYSALLGPVAGIMVCDYFLVRGTELDVNSLYHREGAYHYSKGFNPRAIAALVAGIGVCLPGAIFSSLHVLYDYAWFVGFFVAGAVYVALMKAISPIAVGSAVLSSECE